MTLKNFVQMCLPKCLKCQPSINHAKVLEFGSHIQVRDTHTIFVTPKSSVIACK